MSGKRSVKKMNDSVLKSGFIDSIDYVLLDCDGVLWVGDDAVPGSIEAVKTLKHLGKKILYVTNNSAKSREQYAKKCKHLGYPAEMEDIICTAYIAGVYLKSLSFKKKVFIVGSTGIALELDAAKIQHLPIGPDVTPENWLEYTENLKLEPEVGAVVVGFDPHVSYPKLLKAASYLSDPQCLFIATNKDEKYPGKNNVVIPGAGTIVGAVETVADKKPVVLGKPNKPMIDMILHTHPDMDPHRSLMIGDRLNTDIMLGTKNGMKTMLVLTGNNSFEDVQECEKSSDPEDQYMVPDYYIETLGHFGRLIDSTK